MTKKTPKRTRTSTPRKKAMDYAANCDWPGYFDAVKGSPPRDTLVKALELFEKDEIAKIKRRPSTTPSHMAIDLGCGEGRDTRELLRRKLKPHWTVLAIDGSSTGLEILAQSLRPSERKRVRLVQCHMEDLPRAYENGVPRVRARTPSLHVDLINASFSIPFCKSAGLPKLWRWIDGLIKPGGRFCGQIFGDRDTWAHVRTTTGLTRGAVDKMFRNYVFEELREEETDGRTTMGELKHWHVFHVVARKRDRS